MLIKKTHLNIRIIKLKFLNIHRKHYMLYVFSLFNSDWSTSCNLEPILHLGRKQVDITLEFKNSTIGANSTKVYVIWSTLYITWSLKTVIAIWSTQPVSFGQRFFIPHAHIWFKALHLIVNLVSIQDDASSLITFVTFKKSSLNHLVLNV